MTRLAASGPTFMLLECIETNTSDLRILKKLTRAKISLQTFVTTIYYVNTSMDLFEQLGFTRHKKSVLLAIQQLILLEFLLNSVDMTISLTPNRDEKLKATCTKPKTKSNSTIREVAYVVGVTVVSFPGNTSGPLYYRSLDEFKIEAPKSSKGSFEAKVQVSCHVLIDLQCRVDSMEYVKKPISRCNHVTSCKLMLHYWVGELTSKECERAASGLRTKLYPTLPILR